MTGKHATSIHSLSLGYLTMNGRLMQVATQMGESINENDEIFPKSFRKQTGSTTIPGKNRVESRLKKQENRGFHPSSHISALLG